MPLPGHPRFAIHFHRAGLANRFLVNDNRLWYANAVGLASADRKPLDGILVKKGPWRDDDNKGDDGARECNVYRQLDVLQYVANDKGDSLRI